MGLLYGALVSKLLHQLHARGTSAQKTIHEHFCCSPAKTGLRQRQWLMSPVFSCSHNYNGKVNNDCKFKESMIVCSGWL